MPRWGDKSETRGRAVGPGTKLDFMVVLMSSDTEWKYLSIGFFENTLNRFHQRLYSCAEIESTIWAYLASSKAILS